MRTVLVALFCLLSFGCTRVAFKEPLGAPVADSDLAFFKGDWIGDKGASVHVDVDKEPHYLLVSYTEEGKEKSYRFTVRTLKDDVAILWLEDVELKCYLPFRVLGADNGVALLYPDDESVKRGVADRKLSGVYDKEKKAWMLAGTEWEELLAGKELWELRSCMPFVRDPKSPPPSKAPEAKP